MRVHSRIAADYPWVRLWYLLQGLDDGTGQLKIPLAVVTTFLDCGDTSVYRWLHDGKGKGAFRHYKIKNGVLKVYLGGRNAVCRHLNLRNWGVVATVPLVLVTSLSGIRAIATGITTQSFQQRSRYAANHKLTKEYRKLYGAPHPNELFRDKEPSSLKSAAGEIPFILHISDTRMFVSKGFTHYGTSQRAISHELGIHTRTVRRHQQAIGMSRRQICQAKYEYGHLHRGFVSHEIVELWAYSKEGTGKTDIGYQMVGDVVHFSDGISPGARKQGINAYNIPTDEFGNRFFKMGGKWWMNRCNVYRETFDLTTMRAAQRKYHYQLSQCECASGRKKAVQGSATIFK